MIETRDATAPVRRGAEAERVTRDGGAALFLSQLAHIGPAAIRTMVDAHGGAYAALAAVAEDVRVVAPEADAGDETDRRRGLTGKQRASLAAVQGRDPARVADDAARKAERELAPGDRLLAYGEPGYPNRLERLHFPPPVLWARGPLPADAPRAVAIVGTRRATRAARDLAGAIARGVAGAGVRVVSGLASGIDGAAHRGALDAGGETVGVLGSGLRHRYPRANHDLYRRLRVDGLLLTEFPPAVPPEGHNFPRRNRIVAALADAVLVVHAGRRSGALLTADEAKEIGVDVLACPGDPTLPGSAGCHDLLRDGAGLVTSAADALAHLGWGSDPAPMEAAACRGARGSEGTGAVMRPEAELALLNRLDREPAALDELAELTGGIREATVVLARLELAGVIRGLPGGRFTLVVDG